jgi:hypothetical protein
MEALYLKNTVYVRCIVLFFVSVFVTMNAYPSAETYYTYVLSEEIGNIAVRIDTPNQPRYPEGAPIMVEVSTWFVPGTGFHSVNDTTVVGAINVSYMWSERYDPESGFLSEGEYDYGGPLSLITLRDVIRFACGQIPNADGLYLHELINVEPIYDNVGLFASSHAGVVGTNVLAAHGQELPLVKYFVGRENPTRDEMYPLELGYYDEDRNPVYNPFYHPENYTSTTIDIDYSSIGWYFGDGAENGRPYFAAQDGTPEHILHPEIHPTMFGKSYYSRGLTKALEDNNAFGDNSWPDYLATFEDTQEYWPYRTTVNKYPLLRTSAPDLKVMLVFADEDHVQAAPDKPHIHQAYDGFGKTAELWIRLNPDLAYVQEIQPNAVLTDYPDTDAYDAPDEWTDVRSWGFPLDQVYREFVWIASVTEMMDRVYTNNWENNLDSVLVEYTADSTVSNWIQYK